MTALPYGDTHEVTNQPPPLADYNLYSSDRALRDAVAREGAGWAEARLAAHGARLGQAETLALGDLANRNPPVLHTVDRFGHRLDSVEFHPAWHQLMGMAVGEGLHSAPWADPKPGAHVARAAGVILHTQVECGTQCPVTMTYGSVPALRRQAGPWDDFLPRILSRRYDPAFRPIAEKAGALVGMGMTEKQGGSDVRANTTRAEPAGDGAWRLIGHKWFFSAPMCDAFLVLAQAPGGLSCFFLPRWLPDGSINRIRIQRLKEKVGNRSNASSEVEFLGATAWMLGEEGRGVPTIIEMGTYTRLDCALGSTGLMRQAVSQALHHTAHRSAFQRRLIDQPLMQSVLADMALESEAATALVLRLARAFDSEEPGDVALRRILTPAAKYWICKRGPTFGAEAMEATGGNGYVEDGPLGRIYREMPLNSIWEGSGNVMCLDVLRALEHTPDAMAILRAELGETANEPRLARFVAETMAALGDRSGLEARARWVTERLVLAVQAALLLRGAPTEVAEGFMASRLGEGPGGAFGGLPVGVACSAIIQRAMPA